MLVGIIFIMVAVGLRSGAAGNLVESAPIAGPVVRRVRRSRVEGARERTRERRQQSTLERREISRQAKASEGYESRARKRGTIDSGIGPTSKGERQARIDKWFEDVKGE